MKIIILEKEKLNDIKPNDKARVEHAKILIRENTLIEIKGGKPLLYLTDAIDFGSDIHYHLSNITYRKKIRSNELINKSATFGNEPRHPGKENICRSSALKKDFPYEQQQFVELGKKLSRLLLKHLPKEYSYIRKTLKGEYDGSGKGKKVLNEYVLEGTPFTSGIINENVELHYHYDKGNVINTLSALTILRCNTGGGYLVFPEIKVAFECSNNAILFMDGYNLMHGVSPIVYGSKDAYRYSMVFYNRERMWECLPFKEELAEYRRKETKKMFDYEARKNNS